MQVTLLALLVVTTGCSLDVAGKINEVDARLHPQCGWVADTREPLPVLTAGQCWRIAGSRCALLPLGADACQSAPTTQLRADAGPVIEVYGFGTDATECTTTIEPCDAP